jgi:fused signal recognition particle receptor
MLGLFKKRQAEQPSTPEVPSDHVIDQPTQTEPKRGLLARLSDSLRRTRSHFGEGIARLFLGKKEIDQDLLDQLEKQLLLADVGVKTTKVILQTLTDKVSRQQLNDPPALLLALQQHLHDSLQSCCEPWCLPKQETPYVILMVGVNGSGKTTTIGKLARYFQQYDKQVMLAAGDTFRAAAVEQLQVWGNRHHVPVITQGSGADSAAVAFDALAAAKARHIDVLIIDTAGRLHTQTGLMDELKKVKRVLSKQDPNAPHEVMLVLDAGIGQNAVVQAQQFHQAMGLNSIVLTKLDGTAKGGVIFAIAEQLHLPIRFIGIGEKADDLKPFDATAFVDALFAP